MGNLPFEEGRTVLYRGSDRVKTGVLSEAATVVGIRFPKGSILGFDEEGRLWRCRIAADTEIQGIACREGEVEFHPNGTLAACTLARPLAVKSGIVLREGIFTLFHPNGRLFSGVLADNNDVHGVKLIAGAELCLFEGGGLSSYVTAEDAEVQGVPLQGGSTVWLHPGGRLKAGTISQATAIQSHSFAEGTMVWFHENGQLSGGTLAGDETITGVRIKAGSRVLFFEDGRLRKGVS